MEGACGIHGGKKQQFIQSDGEKNLHERDHLEDPQKNVGIILKYILNKHNMCGCTAYILLNI